MGPHLAQRASAALVMAIAGCSLVGPPPLTVPIDDLDTTPRLVQPVMGGVAPIGGVVEAIRGTLGDEEVAFSGWLEAQGACIEVALAGERTIACGEAPDAVAGRHGGPIIVVEAAGGDLLLTVGMTSSAAASVELEAADTPRGEAALGSLEGSGIDGNLFAIAAPSTLDSELVARNAEGAELIRLVLTRPDQE